jgi:hypothetical protein
MRDRHRRLAGGGDAVDVGTSARDICGQRSGLVRNCWLPGLADICPGRLRSENHKNLGRESL